MIFELLKLHVMVIVWLLVIHQGFSAKAIDAMYEFRMRSRLFRIGTPPDIKQWRAMMRIPKIVCPILFALIYVVELYRIIRTQ